MKPLQKVYSALFGTVLLTVCLGWVYQQASGTLCYSKLGFVYLANVGFWLASVQPVKIAFTKQLKKGKLLNGIIRVGVPTLIFNQLIVYAFVEILFSILYSCESNLLLSELILTNGLLSNSIAFGVIIMGTCHEEINLKFRNTSSGWAQQESVVCIKQNGVTHRITITDIIRIEADNNAVNIYTATKRFVQYGRLKDWEQKTLNSELVRVHRSSIVNTLFVQAYQAKPSGDGIVTLLNGDKIRVSRNFKSNLYSNGRLQAANPLHLSPN